MNKVQLIGYVGIAPITKQLAQGKKLAILKVATHETFTAHDGSRRTNTTWHTIKLWDQKAVYAEANFVKGSKVLIEGTISYHRFEDNGQHRFYTDIRAAVVLNLDR